jgi:low affinity Fe/Cu permease
MFLTSENHKPSKSYFEQFALKVAKASGSSYAFFTALTIVVLWLLTGPLFGFSDTWQLVINTGTTIITFLMVFLIQKSQNLDSLAFKLKLNELIASQKKASNRLLDVEDLSEAEMETLFNFYVLLSKKAEKDMAVHESHSIEEAEFIHNLKKGKKARKKTGNSKKNKVDKENKKSKSASKIKPSSDSTSA